MTSRMKTCGEAQFRVSGFLRLKKRQIPAIERIIDIIS